MLYRFLLLLQFIFIAAEMTSFGQCTATITPSGPLTFCQGGNVVLNANATAGNTYEWRRNGSIVQSGTGITYNATQNGSYTLQITTSTGCIAISSPVTVNVLLNGSGITANGITGSICVNGGITLSAISDPGLLYRWRRNGLSLGGATSSTYFTTIPGQYTCQITNLTCTIVSNTINAEEQIATLTVSGPPIFCSAGYTTLSVSANIGNPGNSFQWQIDSVDIPGANSTTFSPTVSGIYRCEVNNPNLCNIPAYSNSIIIQAGVPPSIYIALNQTGLNPQDRCFSSWADLWIMNSISHDPMVEPATISWWRNTSSNFAGGNPATAELSGQYYTSVVTPCGVSNAVFNLRMLNPAFPPEINHPNGNNPVCAPYYLYVDGAGIFYNTYQWRKDSIDIPGATQYYYGAIDKGNYSCIVSNNCDTMESEIQFINLYPQPDTIISAPTSILCSNSSVRLSVKLGTNFSYKWRLNSQIIAGATLSYYDANQTGTYDCIITSCQDTVYTNGFVLNSANAPEAEISAPVATSLCAGSAVDLHATQGAGYTYKWFRGNSYIQSTIQNVFTAEIGGKYSVVVVDSNDCKDTSEYAPVFFNLPFVTITCIDSFPVCANQFVRLNADISNGITSAYKWYRNGVLIGEYGTPFINITDSGTYSITVSNPCGSVTSPDFPVTYKNRPPATITANGPTGFCPPGNVVLNANTGPGLTYQWYKASNHPYNFLPEPGATADTIIADTTAGYFVRVTAADCWSNSNTIRTSNTGIVAEVTPSGGVTACSSLALNANAVSGVTYQWRKNGIDINGANSQIYNATSSGKYSVFMSGSCGNSISGETDVKLYTTPFDTAITKIYPTNGCGMGYIYINSQLFTNHQPPNSFQWFMNGNPIGNVFHYDSYSSLRPEVSDNYYIEATNACGTQTSNIAAVTVYPLPVISLSANGPTNICNGDSVQLNANSTPGSTLQWMRNNQVINNETAASYTAKLPGSYSCEAVSADGCKSQSMDIDVIVEGNIPTIQPSDSSYVNCRKKGSNTYSIEAIIGATGYVWSVPAGVIINNGQNTTSIKVSYSNAAVNGEICVYGIMNCGNGPSTCIPVTVTDSLPSSPDSISGPAYPCASQTGKIYSCSTVQNASQYIWRVPAGAEITSGQGTNRISVDFDSTFKYGGIQVCALNCKGISAKKTLMVYGKPEVPAGILGPAFGVCPPVTLQYTVIPKPGAPIDYYLWEEPLNSYTSSSQLVASVSFGNQFTGGTLYVSSHNSCGYSDKIALVISTIPSVPDNINGNDVVCAGQTGVNYTISPIYGADTYEWIVPVGATIVSGQLTTSIVVNFGTNTGAVQVRAVNDCGFSNYQTKTIAMPCRFGVELNTNQNKINVFPNPANEEINVIFPQETESSVLIRLSDISGKLLIEDEHTLPGSRSITLNLIDLAAGVYFLKASANKETWIEKVIVE